MRPSADRRASAWRLAAMLLVLAVLGTACGARLTDEQRRLVIAGGGSGDSSAAQGGTADGTSTGGGVAGGAVTSDGSSGSAVVGGTGSGTGQGRPGSTAGDSGTAGGGTGQSGTSQPTDGAGQSDSDQSGGSGGAQQPRDTRAAPPGGNGGATDVGVTEDRIVLSNISDISGAVPGLFADAQKAVQAYVAKFTSTEGTIYGRRIELLARDSKLDSNENRKQYLAACQDSFAAIGSMSAFEQGAATAIRDCGIPDLRTAAVHPSTSELANTVSADALKVNNHPVGDYQYWQEQHPEAVKKAAMLFPTADTTQYQTQLIQDATSQIGYEWIYREGFSTSETNYAPFVIEMKNRGVEFVNFQGAYQMAVRLAETMKQQNYEPTLFALQSNMYTQDFIQAGGDAVEGVQISVNNVLLEEAGQHPELQEYAKWLTQIDPNAQPTGLGTYAWAAAKLAVQAFKDVGPNLTRQKFLEQLQTQTSYDANKLLPPQNMRSQVPTDCAIIVEVRNGAFQRVTPNQGFMCRNIVKQTSTWQ